MGIAINKCAIVGYGETEHRKHPDKISQELMADAIVEAINDAGLEKKDIDGLLVQQNLHVLRSHMNQESINDFMYFSDQLKMLAEVQGGGASAGCMLAQAVAAIQAGMCRVVVVGSALKFPRNVPRLRITRANFHLDFEYIYGPETTAINSLFASRHMHERGFSAEHMAKVAVYQRRWALMHPKSYTYGGEELTVEEVLNSRMVSSPLTLSMCSIPCDGGAACVVTSDDIANTLKHPPVYILGEGECHPYGHVTSIPRTTPTGTYLAARRAYEMAGVTTNDINIGFCYDAFASYVPVFIEDMGFGEGRIGEFINEGHTDIGGDLPWNTHGGLLSGGQAIGTGFLREIGECVIQLRGEAGERQSKKHEIGVAHAFGGMMASHAVLVLGRLN